MSYKDINNTCLLTWEIAFPANILNYITLSYDYHIICPDHLINLQPVRDLKDTSFNIINHVSFCATFVVILNTTLILNISSLLYIKFIISYLVCQPGQMDVLLMVFALNM